MTSGEPLARWIGREHVVDDVVTIARARQLAATLDLEPGELAPGSPLPAGWHWIFGIEATRRRELGEDGHARRGDFLPPVPLRRRMWAGGRLRFERPLRIGDPFQRVSTVRSISEKEGRSGPLVFVTVEHVVHVDGGIAIHEEQDLVYLGGAPAAPRGTPASGAPEWSEAFAADEVTLFRFSALTFNGHRIHYDRPYAVDVEGYPEIVVHGPMLALVLLAAGLRWGGLEPDASGSSSVARFDYRALGPVFCNETVRLCGTRAGGSLDLWVAHPERGATMKAELVITED